MTVLIPIKYKNSKTCVKMTVHTTDVKNPWSVQKSSSKVFQLGRYDDEDDPFEIAFISDGPAECRENLDALICFLIIGGMFSEALFIQFNSFKKENWKTLKQIINVT